MLLQLKPPQAELDRAAAPPQAAAAQVDALQEEENGAVMQQEPELQIRQQAAHIAELEKRWAHAASNC